MCVLVLNLQLLNHFSFEALECEQTAMLVSVEEDPVTLKRLKARALLRAEY